jgi:simple sugar transport system permease protein
MASTKTIELTRAQRGTARAYLAAVGQFLLRSKLYWGLVLLLAVGIATSPVNSRGVNIFLSPGNLSDVLRQVSNNGMVAVGMTLVILSGGIDLSVGSILALASVLCAMLWTQSGWTSAAVISIPITALVLFVLVAWVVQAIPRMRTQTAGNAPSINRVWRVAAYCLGAVVALFTAVWMARMLPGKFGIAGVLVAVPAVGLVFGALNGVLIAKARLQPFIVTLATMVGILGIARVVTGQDASVFPVYVVPDRNPPFLKIGFLNF